jgi:uncharacterized coiled-coil protein SlyX
VLDKVRGRAEDALAWRITQAVDEVRREVDEVRGEVDGRIRALEDRLNGLEPRLVEAEQVLLRMGPQLAALEGRVEDARQCAQPVAASPDDVAEARQLLDAVRAEHERLRARVALASSYEERLRVLEGRPG